MTTTKTSLCRAWACGCEAEAGQPYCSLCREYTPVCPSCAAVYGEHRLTCEVPDGYHDCLEGPWDTEEDATAFAEAEVGAPWGVYEGNGKWYVVVKAVDD